MTFEINSCDLSNRNDILLIKLLFEHKHLYCFHTKRSNAVLGKVLRFIFKGKCDLIFLIKGVTDLLGMKQIVMHALI